MTARAAMMPAGGTPSARSLRSTSWRLSFAVTMATAAASPDHASPGGSGAGGLAAVISARSLRRTSAYPGGISGAGMGAAPLLARGLDGDVAQGAVELASAPAAAPGGFAVVGSEALGRAATGGEDLADGGRGRRGGEGHAGSLSGVGGVPVTCRRPIGRRRQDDR